VARPGRFLTIDRWQDERDWRSFRDAFGPAYEALDARFEGLAEVEQRSLAVYDAAVGLDGGVA